MSNPVYTVEQIADIVAPIAAKYDVSRLYLFGSYARGDDDIVEMVKEIRKERENKQKRS